MQVGMMLMDIDIPYTIYYNMYTYLNIQSILISLVTWGYMQYITWQGHHYVIMYYVLCITYVLY